MLRRVRLPVLLLFLLGGCMTTAYRPMTAADRDKSDAAMPEIQREVTYRVADALYAQAPACVVVWPMDGRGRSAIESAAARYLSGKIRRVIGPSHRDRLARAGAFDLRETEDRRAFARTHACAHGLEIVSGNASRDYFVVWSQQSLSLELAFRSARSGEILWQARHTARRSDGGLPLSPVSFVLDTAAATNHQSDDDVARSLIDDALRRMFVTLPAFR